MQRSRISDRLRHVNWRRLPVRILRLLAGLLLLTVCAVLLLRWVPVPISGMMLERQARTLFDSKAPPLHHSWTPREQISPQAALAVIAAEDQLFMSHHGFDMKAIGKAIEHNRRGGRVRGASTISQQVAKNLFLWSGRSWLRKGLEVGFTVLIEALWPKERILEVYLNIAEFGDGIYGVGAASELLLKTSPERLSANQAARLAAVLPSPRRFSASKPSPYVIRRAAWIQRQMRQLGGVEFLPEWHRKSSDGNARKK